MRLPPLPMLRAQKFQAAAAADRKDVLAEAEKVAAGVAGEHMFCPCSAHAVPMFCSCCACSWRTAT